MSGESGSRLSANGVRRQNLRSLTDRPDEDGLASESWASGVVAQAICIRSGLSNLRMSLPEKPVPIFQRRAPDEQKPGPEPGLRPITLETSRTQAGALDGLAECLGH